MPEEILGRGFIEDKLCELGLGEVTMIWGKNTSTDNLTS